MRIDSSGRIGVGTQDPTEQLDLRGTLKIQAMDGGTYDHPTKMSPIVVTHFGDYQRPVIALAYKYPGSGFVNKSGFSGEIYASRGSSGTGQFSTMISVIVSTAYNTQILTGIGIGHAVFRFVSFTYNSTDYIGVQFNTDANANIWLDGYYSRRNGFQPFSVAQSSVSAIEALNATQDARLATTSSSTI
tara:strand:- start:38 stop:601 length:564 start_codon:yes stop_codon:yes gene_type:complete